MLVLPQPASPFFFFFFFFFFFLSAVLPFHHEICNSMDLSALVLFAFQRASAPQFRTSAKRSFCIFMGVACTRSSSAASMCVFVCVCVCVRVRA